MRSLLVDESADEANRDQLSIFARWPLIDSNTSHIHIVDQFLGLVNVEKHDSESVLIVIQ